MYISGLDVKSDNLKRQDEGDFSLLRSEGGGIFHYHFWNLH